MQDSNYLVNSNSEPEVEVSLAEIIFRYLRHWKYFVISVVVCVSVAYLYLQYTIPLYKVGSTVIVGDKTISSEVMVFSDIGIVAPKGGSTDNEIEILKSKTLMRKVADSLKLNVVYSVEGFFVDREIYKQSPVLVTVNEFYSSGNFIIDKAGDNGFVISSKDANFTKKIFLGETFKSPWGLLTVNNNEDGEENFPVIITILRPDALPRITITPLKGSNNVVEISIVVANTEKGKDIVSTLIDIHNNQVIETKNLVSTQTIRFINDRLAYISKELENVEKEVEDYKKERNIIDLKAESGILLSANTEYTKRISELDLQISILNWIKNLVLKDITANTVVATNMGLTDPIVLGLLQGYNESLLEKDRATLGLKPENPILQEHNERIANVKENLLKGIGIEETRLKLVRSELVKRENLNYGEIRGLSTQERESRELFRQKDIKETLFLYLLQKREETGLTLALATPSLKIIDKAYADKTSVKPTRGTFLLGALLLGLIIPVCVIYLISLFRVKIESKEELISAVKAPFLGVVPITESDDPFPVKELKSRIAEKFRIIIANLSFLLGKENNKVIIVSSTVSGEGKSFFARNLALSLATSGSKTLLIDGDIRKSKLDALVNFQTNKGLAQYLADPELEIDDIIEKSGSWNKNLHIIPTRMFPPNPAELLASKRLASLFDKVKDEYDYIVVDTPPVGLVADVFRFNQFANVTIYLTRLNYTHKSSLKEIREYYEKQKLHNLACVINGVSKKFGYEYDSAYYEYVKDKK